MEHLNELILWQLKKIDKYNTQVGLNPQDSNKENSELENWFKEVTEPKFKLLDNLIRMVSEILTSETTKQLIYKTLSIAIKRNPNVIDKLRNSNIFCETVTDYIFQSTTLCSIDQYAFHVLTNIFKVDKIIPLVKNNKNFIEALFDSLNLIDEEEVFEKIIDIILEINNAQEKELKKNLVMRIYIKHENSNLFNEVVLRELASDPRNHQINIVLKFINQALKKENKIIFAEADYEPFINALINKITSSYNDKMKKKVLKVFIKLTDMQDYYDFNYKLQELADYMDKLVSKHKDSAIKGFAQKVLDNIVFNLQNQIQRLNNELKS